MTEVTPEFKEMVLQVLQEYSSALENEEGYPRGADVVMNPLAIANVLSLPGVRYKDEPPLIDGGGNVNESAQAEAYVQIPYAIISQDLVAVEQATQAAETAAGNTQTAIDGANTAAQAANTAATNADNSRQQIEANESTRQSNEATRQSHETGRVSAESGRVSAESGRVTAEQGRVSAENSRVSAESGRVTQANSDHTRAESDHTKVAGAENLNAQLVGFTVTITNRQGVSTSVDIGFDIYRTYTSVAAMNADAANVPQGKFVTIATTNTTDPDNAKLFQKNSQGTFTFLSDLDQASASAWADWLDNMKPQIETAIDTADNDHTRAESDHSTATSDHTQAGNDHTRAESDHSTATSDHTQAGTDHATATTDHTTAGTDHTRAESDHSTASSDHTQAGQDHSRAESDHTTAGNDSTQAGQDHTRAENDHSTASTDHGTAGDDHTRAESDHTASVAATNAATTQANRAKGYNDHPWEIGDDGYIYVWDETMQTMVKTEKMIISFNDLTEEQKEEMAQAFYDSLVFASVATCESIIDELI